MNKPISEEICDMFLEACALEDMRDKYIKRWGGHKKALKCTKDMIKLKRKAWVEIHKLYPELKDKKTVVDFIDRVIKYEKN